MLLTAKNVAKLTLPPGKQDHIQWDIEVRGFGYRLRAGASGKVLRSWIVQYRAGGGTRRVLLGSASVLAAEAARAAAKKLLAAVALGQDPQAERAERRHRDRLTLRAVIDEYLQAKRPDVRANTFILMRRYLTGPYFRTLHGKPVDGITRKDIATRLLAIVGDNGSVTAVRARSTMHSFFVWAMQMGLVEHNPVIGAVKPKDNASRTRVLDDAEIAAIWRACGDDDYGRVLRLMVLTACRRQEIGGMRWSELDAERGTWTLPGGRSKNGRAHTLSLPAMAWDIIRSVPRLAGRDQLFGVSAGDGFTAWAQAKAALDQRLGDTVAPFVLHDIRRSTATRLADLGVQPHVIEQILNHQSGHRSGVAGIYNRSSYEREVRTALTLWADHIRALVDGGERKVVAFAQSPASAC